jgi:hypothetical protein
LCVVNDLCRLLLALIRNETLCMVEKGRGIGGSGSGIADSGSGRSTADTQRELERQRMKNVHNSFVDSAEAVNIVGSDEVGKASAGKASDMNARFDNDEDHDEEASGAFNCDDDEEEIDYEEDDWFAETETHRDLYRQFEDDTDAALDKQLDEQMEAMWDEYSDDVHAQIQNELDQALQQQMDEQFEQLNKTYNYNRVELDPHLEENWDLRPEDEFEHEYSSRFRYEREELEPSSTKQFTSRFPVEHHSSVASINALIQQVVEKHQVKL